MSTTKDDRINLDDEINRLHQENLQLREQLAQSQTTPKRYLDSPFAIPLFVTPVALIFLLLLGLNFKYESKKFAIAYSNSDLVEIGLSGLTLLTGAYSIQRYKNKEDEKRDST